MGIKTMKSKLLFDVPQYKKLRVIIDTDFENMVTYNNSPAAGWTKGESWSLGDSPAVGVALNPDCGHYIEHEAPFVNEDTSSSFGKENPKIRIYTDIDSRYLLEDFFAKLQLNYRD